MWHHGRKESKPATQTAPRAEIFYGNDLQLPHVTTHFYGCPKSCWTLWSISQFLTSKLCRLDLVSDWSSRLVLRPFMKKSGKEARVALLESESRALALDGGHVHRVCCFGTFFVVPFSWECHHPNLLNHIFQRGRLNHQPVIVCGSESVHSSWFASWFMRIHKNPGHWTMKNIAGKWASTNWLCS